MKTMRNPFITSGYVSAEYFCDREEESRQLVREVTNGNNLALISTRRMGKSGLIKHCFQLPAIKERYYTFFVDIYDTRSLRDFTFALSKEIVEVLKPRGRRALESFVNSVRSLQAAFALDINGLPTPSLGLGDIQVPASTLDEIFRYLEHADKPCLVAIDEFQQIAEYGIENIEATLRTYVQRNNNTRFIFAGSQRHVMSGMFLSPARPFYQSVSMMHLDRIDLEAYIPFARRHFTAAGKSIEVEAVTAIYQRFEGITWYVQKVLNTLYDRTPWGGVCKEEEIDEAIRLIVGSYDYAYSETIFRLPERQKELLIAIAKEGRAQAVTSATFTKKHHLVSASSVQAALRGLLEKDFVTQEKGIYQTYDRFLAIWLTERYG
ncbi:MAG: ATPase [Mediterranea sp.]|nr:ATPase [Mediterranea sp.]